MASTLQPSKDAQSEQACPKHKSTRINLPRHHQLGQLDPFQVQPTASKGEWFRVQLTVGKLKSAFTFNR